VNDLSLICGQRPVLTRAKKAIASFKLRKGMVVGAKVTLRGGRMYDFLERLVKLVLPRTRDFHGITATSIDKDGNLTLAIKEHIAFPEVSPEKSRVNFGLEITVATSARGRKNAENLFSAIGFPIR
jgi:large subunit ribosomal protein L5